MTTIRYEDFSEICSSILQRVERTGETFEVTKNGIPFIHIVAVDPTENEVVRASR